MTVIMPIRFGEYSAYNIQIHVPLALAFMLAKLYEFLVLVFTRASVSLSEIFAVTTKGSCLVRLLKQIDK